MDRLSELSRELGYPSAQKLWSEAQRLQLEVTRKQVLDFVKTQAVRQVFRQRKAISGRIVATEIMDRWAADLIDYNARPSPDPDGGEPYQYILIVQDIFSRKLWAHALKVKSQEVVQQAFEAIVRRAGTPDNLDTDNGHEFKGRFQDYLVEQNIQHDVADPRSRNARATLDAAIKSIRQQLARIQLAEGNRAWASALQRAVEAYNRTVHSSLIGRAPQNVYWDKVLQFDLRSKAADDIAQNNRARRFRANNLERLGAFRDELLPGTKFERSYKAPRGGLRRRPGHRRAGPLLPHSPRLACTSRELGSGHLRDAWRQREDRQGAPAVARALQEAHRGFCGTGQDRERGRAIHEVHWHGRPHECGLQLQEDARSFGLHSRARSGVFYCTRAKGG